MDLSVIIPVYKGEKTLVELYNRIKKVLENEFLYEILFVYDSGRDKSWEIIQVLIRSDPSIIRGFHLVRNYGQHNATLFGMKKANGDIIITMDEDLQHNPEFIPDLLREQRREDYDVVYGKFIELQHPGIRIWTSEILRNILKIIVPDIYHDYSSFRLIKRSLAEKITVMKNSYCFIDGLIGSATERISSFPVKHYKRTDGASSYNCFKLFKHAILIAIAYSKIKTWLLLASFLFILPWAVMHLINHEVNSNGFTRLINGFLIIGITLLSIGLITGIIHYRNLNLNSEISEKK